ncbi:Serine-protein kinase ATM [Zootermopsis nevadensis]|uniref:Serine-protein kinase ATM n=1 Tax=Zootermopsis nevadensis TaxID=136037 RepID=A0A067RDX4_ZOONE|nr:Serine-protein kinase ATM [Zootermopsis nevadensis]
MGTIERDLMECCTGCDSNKVTERKKSMERLSELLMDSQTAKILGRSDSGNNLTWDSLFHSVHKLILKEADRFRAEEQKPQSSSSSQTNRENMKLKCSALIDNVVTKAIKGVPELKCSNVMFCILQILNDVYLRKCFGRTYLLILKEILRVRKYWGDMTSDDWNELLDVCFMLYEEPPTGLDKAPVAEILYWIVKCGTLQSHLGLQLRKKFPPLARAFKD